MNMGQSYEDKDISPNPMLLNGRRLSTYGMPPFLKVNSNNLNHLTSPTLKSNPPIAGNYPVQNRALSISQAADPNYLKN